MNNNYYQDRAKQFMPFDALKGLQEELRKKENNVEKDKENKEEKTKVKIDMVDIK